MIKIEEINSLIDKEGDIYNWNYKGFRCSLKRNLLRCWCGYVTIPIEIPIDLKEDDYYPFDCHGGVTYQEFSDENKCWTVGFDCAHYNDLVPYYYEISLPGKKLDDSVEYRTKDFAIKQTNGIVDQILSITSIRRNLRIDSILK
jgi:hypothetical protein